MGKVNSSSSSRSLKGYATAISGLAAAATFAPPAEAGILHTDIPDLTMSTINELIDFDLDQSGTSPYAILNGSPTGVDFRLRSTGVTDVTTAVSFNGAQMAGYYLLKLSAGTTIDSSLPWHMGNVAYNVTYFEFFDSDAGTGWQGGAEGYIGLRIPDFLGGYNYGWALLNYDDAGNTMTLKEFAIEQTVDTAIAAGDTGTVVPEPSSLALLALGAGATCLANRRRKTTDA